MNDYPREKNDSQIIDIQMLVSSRFINHSYTKARCQFSIVKYAHSKHINISY